MNKKQEKWAIFWCDLLSPVIYGQIDKEQTHQFLKLKAKEQIQFPDGRIGKPSIKTLHRKLKRYLDGGFDALARKKRRDQGAPRNIPVEVIKKAIELKKEQPYRSPTTINHFLEEMYGITVPRATLYRHLKQAGATRMKLGVIRSKVRKRWSREHTHDLWIGDFEEGPYVLEKGDVVPAYQSAFIDCHSRYIVEARYYFRVIDEAHLLDPQTLINLRLLISSIDEKIALKIVLSGQEDLSQILKRSSHADLDHRISLRFILRALSKEKTFAYIDYRISKAGGPDKIFEPEAKELIHDYSGGVPRQINNIATACLINAAARGTKKISVALVNDTMNEFPLP